LLLNHAVNAPRLDDFPEILTFLPDWHAAVSLDEKLAVLFRDYQNHRYVLYHGLLVFFDHINFRTATIWGNLPLVVMCALMMQCVAKSHNKMILWLITPLLIFNLQSWRAMFWGPLGTTNLLYPTLALLACWLVTRGTRGVICAGLTATALTLSHGSGPILFPVITVYLWFEYHQGKLTRTFFFNWTGFVTITLILYFLIFPLNSTAGYSSLQTGDLLLNFFTKTGDILKGFLAILGSHLLMDTAASNARENLSIFVGTVELIWLGFLLRRGALRTQPALLLWLAFILLTTASIASGRVALAGVGQAMQGHYKLLNGIFMWFLLAATLDWALHKTPRQLSIANMLALTITTGLYLCALWMFFSPMQKLQLDLLQDARQWQHSGKLQHIETQIYVKQPNKKIKAAFDGGFYNPEE